MATVKQLDDAEERLCAAADRLCELHGAKETAEILRALADEFDLSEPGSGGDSGDEEVKEATARPWRDGPAAQAVRGELTIQETEEENGDECGDE